MTHDPIPAPDLAKVITLYPDEAVGPIGGLIFSDGADAPTEPESAEAEPCNLTALDFDWPLDPTGGWAA